MGKLEELIEKLKRLPPEADFSDIERLTESRDFHGASAAGSHLVYRHEDGRIFTVPTLKGRKVKRPCIVRVLDLLGIGEEDANDV